LNKTGLYVYGIINNIDDNLLHELAGVDGKHNLISIAECGVYAVASQVDLDEYGENSIESRLEDMVWVEDKARRHFNIQQYLFSTSTFIPVRFCTIYTDEGHLREFISLNSDKFLQAFCYFADKDEWTFKAYCDKRKFLEQNMEEERQLLCKQLENVSKGVYYFALKKQENTIENQAKEKLGKIRDDIWEHIKANVDDATLNKNLSRQVTERREEMIMNVALLVSRNRMSSFKKECEILEESLGRLNINIELTGPWPVYNFSAQKIS